ncbi:4'-phosphopantetheinyl transferase family protein [Tundrisphaera sp. TA3]|uniref:4'-phosphopantetheinyl transferase family protein n=1 Tax=Tundrisphaera sp. TA3 TaxID=3435775 RepID=UPI003EBE3DA9
MWPTPIPRFTLEPDEVHVWTASREAPDDRVAAFRALLSDAEIRRADRFAFERDRRQFATGRGLLRTLLGAYLGLDPRELRFEANAHGKPELIPEQGGGLRFNLAHSGTWVLYALARDRAIGVDIEKVRPDFGGDAIAGRFFAPGEVEALRSLPPDRQTLAFFHGWARKEAYIKAKGKGLALPLDTFEVAIDPDAPASLLATHADPPEAATWSLVELPTEPGFVAAACVEGHAWRLRRGRWGPDGGEPSLAPSDPIRTL